jgi:hypothetical protein
VNQRPYLSGPTILIGVVSITNICLLVTAAFYREGKSTESAGSTLRVKLGYIAVSLALCSQVLYCLMLAAWIFSWIPPDPGNSVIHLVMSLSRIGSLLSTAALFAALFGRGLRRIAGLWVAVSTGFLGGSLALGASLSSVMTNR